MTTGEIAGGLLPPITLHDRWYARELVGGERENYAPELVGGARENYARGLVGGARENKDIPASAQAQTRQYKRPPV